MKNLQQVFSMTPRSVLLSTTLPIGVQNAIIAELNIENPLICRAPKLRRKIFYSVAVIKGQDFEVIVKFIMMNFVHAAQEF